MLYVFFDQFLIGDYAVVLIRVAHDDILGKGAAARGAAGAAVDARQLTAKRLNA